MPAVSERANKDVRRRFGPRLRQLRKERQLSQEALGQRSDLSGKFVGEVERGEKSISLDSQARVAKALDVSLEELVRGIDRGEHNPEADRIYTFLLAKKPGALSKARVFETVKALVG